MTEVSRSKIRAAGQCEQNQYMLLPGYTTSPSKERIQPKIKNTDG